MATANGPEQLDLFEPFNFEKDQNDSNAWAERDLMEYLAYRDKRSFRKAIQRAMQAWVAIGFDPGRDFMKQVDGDYKLTRTACYLVAMNADSKKPRVAQAQMYFVTLANIIERLHEEPEAIDRIVIREEVADGMKALAATAQERGVVSYGRFMDAGYHGMYNMSLEALTEYKRVPVGDRLIDHMGRAELAANLFRVTQTDEKIRNDPMIFGQEQLEQAATEVGAVVRETMIKLNDTPPEDLPISEHISEAHSRLKATHRTLKKVDKQPKYKRMLDTQPLDRPGQPDPGYTVEPEEPSDE